MSYGSDKLHEIGIQKIHIDTHITLMHINAILNEDFSIINRVQFLGFLSILEREYDIDLSDIRADGEEFYKQQKDSSSSDDGVFVTTSSTKTFKALYISTGLILFLAAIIFTINYPFDSDNKDISVDNNVINEVKKSIIDEELKKKDEFIPPVAKQKPQIKPDVEPKKRVVEVKKRTILKESAPIKIQKDEPKLKKVSKKVVEPIKPLVVFPKRKLWIGYIDVIKNKKYQKIITKPLTLDGDRKWLLFLGHGNVNIEVNGKLKEYKTKNSLRFAYKNGKIKRVTLGEFKKINRGNRW
jgi:hypothetical protein